MSTVTGEPGPQYPICSIHEGSLRSKRLLLHTESLAKSRLEKSYNRWCLRSCLDFNSIPSTNGHLSKKNDLIRCGGRHIHKGCVIILLTLCNIGDIINSQRISDTVRCQGLGYAASNNMLLCLSDPLPDLCEQIFWTPPFSTRTAGSSNGTLK